MTFKSLYFHELLSIKYHVGQSHVEIKGYFVVYFDRIAVFEVPYHWTPSNGKAKHHFFGLMDEMVVSHPRSHSYHHLQYEQHGGYDSKRQ